MPEWPPDLPPRAHHGQDRRRSEMVGTGREQKVERARGHGFELLERRHRLRSAHRELQAPFRGGLDALHERIEDDRIVCVVLVPARQHAQLLGARAGGRNGKSDRQGDGLEDFHGRYPSVTLSLARSYGTPCRLRQACRCKVPRQGVVATGKRYLQKSSLLTRVRTARSPGFWVRRATTKGTSL